MKILKRFKSLPVNTQRLMGLGAVLALTVALPLFIWAIVTQKFLFNQKAAEGQVSVTGGAITNSGGNTIHTFTSNGTFEVAGGSLAVQYLLVGGGGSGGGGYSGGGGAGGVLEGSITLAPGSYPVTIGTGGSGNVGAYGCSNDGSPSSFNGQIANGGGGGGGQNQCNEGHNGGSGGGSFRGAAVGIGNQGHDGGSGPRNDGAGGGGGGGGNGGNGTSTTGGSGGAGYVSPVFGITLAGGGGGWNGIAGSGQAGGGTGSETNASVANGQPNTGGGGGGGMGAGGSGIVIIRYTTLISPTPTPTPTPTPPSTPPPLGTSYSILLKFDGVTGGSADGAKVKVFVKTPTETLESPALTASHQGNGIYRIVYSPSVTLSASTQYPFYLKGEKHLKARFCIVNSAMTKCPVTASASDGITLGSLGGTLNLTAYPLIPGDVTPQDGKADGSDLAKIIQLMNKPNGSLTADDKLTGDLNYDGYINVKDAYIMSKVLNTNDDF